MNPRPGPTGPKEINVYHSSQSSEIGAVKDRLIHSKIYFDRERERDREIVLPDLTTFSIDTPFSWAM